MKQDFFYLNSLIALGLMLALLISSCGSPQANNPNNTIPPSEVVPTIKVVAAPNTTATGKVRDTIQGLVDNQLLSASEGILVWENRFLTLSHDGLGSLAWLPLDVAASNFVLYTEFAWDSSDTGETACGVSFRDNSQGDFYMSLVRKNGDGLLWLSSGNQWQASPHESYGNFLYTGNNAVNELILIVENEQITLRVNDRIFYQATDYSLNSGSISLITGTALAGNTCTFENSWIWEIKDTQLPPPQASNPTLENYDLYVGFPGNNQVPFVVLHADGEQLSVTQNASGIKTGIVWSSLDSEPIFISADERGRPLNAVVGEDIVHYTNYTDSTVDLTVIHQNGTIEYFRVMYDSDFVRKIEARKESPFSFASFTMDNALVPNQQDFRDYLDYGFIALGAISCASLLATANPTILLVAASCGGLILDVAEKVAEVSGIDVRIVDAIGIEAGLFDSLECAVRGFRFNDCVEVVANVAEITYDQGKNIIENMRLPAAPPEQPTQCRPRYGSSSCP